MKIKHKGNTVSGTVEEVCEYLHKTEEAKKKKNSNRVTGLVTSPEDLKVAEAGMPKEESEKKHDGYYQEEWVGGVCHRYWRSDLERAFGNTD